MKLTGLLFLLLLIISTSSCKHVVKYDCTGTTPTYTEHVQKILVSCGGSECHNGGHSAADMDLSTYAGAVAASKKKSFMGSIQHLPLYQQMPKDAVRLDDAQIQTIYCWIQNGTPE